MPRLGQCRAEQASPVTEVSGVLLAVLTLSITMRTRGSFPSLCRFYKFKILIHKFEKNNGGDPDLGPRTKARDWGKGSGCRRPQNTGAGSVWAVESRY